MGTRLERSDVMAAVDALEREGRFLDAIDVLTSANRTQATRRSSVGSSPSATPRSTSSYGVALGARRQRRSLLNSRVRTGSRPCRRTSSRHRQCAPVSRRVVACWFAAWSRRISSTASSMTSTEPSRALTRTRGGSRVQHDARFEPFLPGERYRKGYKVEGKRAGVRAGGGAWTTDSPRTLYDLTDSFDRVQLIPVITGFPGERPALSMQGHAPPSSAHHGERRLAPGRRLPREAHPDPERLARAVTGGPRFPWARRASSPTRFDRGARDAGRDLSVGGDAGHGRASCRGDARLPTDLRAGRRTPLRRAVPASHRLRTGNDARAVREMWLFAPSVYPGKQIPLVI
jgi:hypothetical protein